MAQGSALKTPIKLSPILAEFVGSPEMSRADVTKAIWAYIKSNNLQDPTNKREINCDEKLSKLMGTQRINMMKIATAVNPHFIKKA